MKKKKRLSFEHIFYSKKERILFCVAGYTNASSNVVDIIVMLQDYSQLLTDLCNSTDIQTFEVTTSRRYKYMRIFHCVTDVVPTDAFVIGDYWNMAKWLEN